MHVPLPLGNVDIDRKMELKHIGMVLDVGKSEVAREAPLALDLWPRDHC